MKSLTTVLKFAALPAIPVAYVAFMGSTGYCPTCAKVMDWTLGRSAIASETPVANASAQTTTAAAAPAKAPVEPGPMHRLVLPGVDGKPIDLAAYAGKPMLIEVWATWCGPCVRLRSALKSVAPQLAEKATVVAVSVDQGGAAAVARHLKTNPSTFVEALSTPEFRAALLPHNPGNTIPKLVYVDANGNIAGIEPGGDPRWVLARLDALQ